MLDYSKGTPTPNFPILSEFNTLKTAVLSSAESETGGTFEVAQNLIPLRHILENFTYISNSPKALQSLQIISHHKASSLVLSNLNN